jgi:hypothetical protein
MNQAHFSASAGRNGHGRDCRLPDPEPQGCLGEPGDTPLLIGELPGSDLCFNPLTETLLYE